MVKFDFIIEKMLATDLTRVIITSNYSHLNLKWDIPSTTAKFSGFRYIFCNENYGTNMTKNCALHLGDFLRYFFRIVIRIELINHLLEHSAALIIQRSSIFQDPSS